jgi:uncharacterized iron-regulated membrane protein
MQQAKTPRALVVRLHRWLSLAFAGFWLLQAVTGVLIVYHWEIADAALGTLHRPTDLAAIERRIAVLAPPGSGREARWLWTTAGLPDRYDIGIAEPGGGETAVRIAGDGTVLRSRDGEALGVTGVLVVLHQKLLAGETGEWIVGISGVLLLSNLLLALGVAWPRGGWRRALRPSAKGPPAARSYAWHRAVGLWAVIPALVLVGAGTLLRFEHGVGEAIGAASPQLPVNPPVPGAARPGFAAAVGAAQAAIPGSTLTAVTWPAADDASWRIRLREPGENRRAYGTSVVVIDANTGRPRGVFPASRAPAAQGFMEGLFAVHTGEFGGAAGRVLVLLLGLWLATMIGLGLQLWWRRRPRSGR